MLGKIKKFFLYFIIVYAIIGFIVLPLVLKPQLVKILQENTNTKVSIAKVYFNPFVFNLELQNVKIDDLNKKAIFSFESMTLNVNPSSLFMGAVHIHLFEIKNPKINLVRNQDKTWNVLNILKKDKKVVDKKSSSSSFKMPRVIIDTISIVEGRAAFSDYTLPQVFRFGMKNIGLKIKNIDTEQNKNPKGTIRFYATMNDNGFIDFKSKIKHYRPFATSGSLDFKANKLYTEWKYVKNMLNVEVADGKIYLHAQYSFNSSDINATEIKNASIRMNNLRIKPKNAPQNILTLKSFTVTDINAVPLQNRVSIAQIALNKLNVALSRTKTNKIDWTEYLKVTLPKSKKKPVTTPRDKNSTLALLVKKISLTSSNVTFKDKMLAKTATNTLNDINITLYDINSKKGSWLKYDTSFKIDKKGLVSTKGKLRASPLKQIGSFDIKKISLKALTPYLQESSYLSIEDGLFSAKGTTKYEKNKNAPDLDLEGSLKLDSLFINNRRENSLLFSLNSLGVKSYTLELFPNRLHIDEIGINSFYLDAQIDKNRVLNFSKLMKKTTKKKRKVVKKTKGAKSNFPVKIDKIAVALGSAKFQDYSIPIKFKTNIHNLNGVIYSLTNMKGEHTLINLHGDIDKYGSTRIQGSIDGLNPKKFTDINMNFKNLDLTTMSGYSAEFAGYEIDSGKLFLDLGYDIRDAKLKASNSIVIKKIELGNEVKDENATHLPLGFVIGLLEDDKGVIDIDMPIDGDVDKPDFKYGKLVWNTFTNLITRAVTAPFKFLGAMLGINSDDLEYVAFEDGHSDISPMQREKMDRLAKIMLKRPKLLLKVKGVYDKQSDKVALQKEKLIALVLQKSGLKNRDEHQSAMTLDMLEEIYLDNSKKKELETLRAKAGKEYRKELIAACVSMMKVDKSALKNLANSRVKNLVKYLDKEKNIPLNRIHVSKGIREVQSERGFVNLELNLAVQ